MEGHGVMRVQKVGDATEMGKVFTESQIDDSVRTPLNEQLDRLAVWISRRELSFRRSGDHPASWSTSLDSAIGSHT